MKPGFISRYLPAAAVALNLGLAAYFIFDHLGLRAFWLDEASVANLLIHPAAALPARAAVDGCPILYAFILKAWAALFGDGEFALRSFSAAMALLCVLALYFAGKEAFGDKIAGFFASYMAATNYFLIYFATQNKVYTLAALAGVLSHYFFLRAARRGTRGDCGFYAAAGTVSLYLHPWLFLVFAGQALSVLLLRRHCTGWRRILLVQAGIFALALPNAAVTLYQGSLDANSWMSRPTLGTVLSSFGYLSYGSTWLYAAISAAAVAVFFWKRDARQWTGRQKFACASSAVYLFFPLLAACAVSQVSHAYVPARYEMSVLPAFLLLLTFFWMSLRRWPVLAGAAAAGLAVFAALSVTEDRRTIDAYRSTDKSVVQGLLDRMKDGDIVIATDLSYSTASYYFRRLNRGSKAVRIDLLPFPAELGAHPSWKNLKAMSRDPERYDQEARRLALELKARVRGGGTVWVLYNSSGPINALFRERFSAAFLLSREESPPTPREPAWFDKILMFRH